MEDNPGAVVAAIVLAVLMLFGFMLMDRCSSPRKPLGEAPDVGISVLMQAPYESLGSLRELRGQAVVIEFWATWCDKCRETIPHMNKLRETFRGRPVVFISATREPRAVIEPFLREHPISGWIAIDEDRRLESAFRVRGLPDVFVIDPQGRIRIRIGPSFLYQSDIERALSAREKKKTVQ
ncbi:MAG: TlpA family protein disulfide reductase [Elusimicrobia bacterium]|nr:TlpA family protein disulfide reductase [Elusimicrobiota bacterium]